MNEINLSFCSLIFKVYDEAVFVSLFASVKQTTCEVC